MLKRRNIEDLSQDELADYIHAVTLLSKKPDADPGSYVSLAQIHNSSSNPCPHNTHLFLPWHRGLLSVYEKALQAVDPPRTANVTLPYYDFTKVPGVSPAVGTKGQRYPAAFEVPGSILNQMVVPGFGWLPSNRNKAPISTPFVSPSTVRTIIDQNPNWAIDNTSTGGNTNGFGGIDPDGGKGAWESPPHDDMHSAYIGGRLAISTTAADDPVFWSFHCFVDLVWHRWQRTWPNSVITGLKEPLEGMIRPDGSPWALTVEQVLDVRDLGFEYEDSWVPTPPPSPPTPFIVDVAKWSLDMGRSLGSRQVERAGSLSQRDPHVAERAAAGALALVAQTPVDSLQEDLRAVVFVIERFGISHTLAFSGFVFLHPEDESFDGDDPLFRERYLVSHFSSMPMRMGPNMGPMHTDLSMDLTGELRRLAESAGSTRWVLSTAVQVDRNDKDPASTAPPERLSAKEAAKTTTLAGTRIEVYGWTP